MSVRSLVALLLAVALSALWGASSQAQDAEPVAVADVLASYDTQIAEIEQQLASAADTVPLWHQLLTLSGMRFAVERNASGTPVTQEESRAFSLALIARWTDAEPEAPEPYLMHAAMLPQEERAPFLLELEDRFGGHPAFLARLLSTLRYDGDVNNAERIVDDLLNSEPDADQYDTLWNHLSQGGEGARLDQMIERWILDHPGDPTAHAASLLRGGQRNESAESMRAAAQRAVDAFEAADFEEAFKLCSGAIARLGVDELVEDCYRKLLTADLEASERARTVKGLARYAAGRGNIDEAGRLLAQLSVADRREIVASMVTAESAAGNCSTAIGLFERVGHEGSTAGATLARLFADCGASSSELGDLRRRAVALDAEALRYLIDRWSPRRDPGPVIELATAHLERNPGEKVVWRSLENLLERHELTDQREAHLKRWIANAEAGADQGERKDLAELLLAKGDSAAAIEVLQAGVATANGASRPFLLGPLAETLLSTGNANAARELIEELASASDDYWRTRARYLKAQLAWLEGEEDLAFSELSEYLATVEHLDQEAVVAAGSLALTLERTDSLRSTLEQSYALLHQRGSAAGGFDRWAAGLFEQAGLPLLARDHLEAALREVPSDAQLIAALGRVESALGEDSALSHLRRSVDADPYDSSRWQQVIEHQLDSGAIDDALLTLDRAYAMFDSPPQGLLLLEARILYDREEFLEVARLLRPIARGNQFATQAVLLLRQAYKQLGGEP